MRRSVHIVFGVSDAPRNRGFSVRDPAGDVIAQFETFEEAQAAADERARRARLPGVPGACWEVVRPRAWRRPRVLHRAYPPPSGPDQRGGGPGGVREPRRPLPSSSSGAIELEPPG
jgi:hypothetical protein